VPESSLTYWDGAVTIYIVACEVKEETRSRIEYNKDYERAFVP